MIHCCKYGGVPCQQCKHLQVTWYHQLMAEINKEMSAVAGSGRTFVLPVTAATQYRAVNMIHTQELRCSPTIQLALPLLTAEQKEAAVIGLARKVAAANGRTAPTTIPAAFRKLLDFVGSTPIDLTYVMGALGGLIWRNGDGWQKGRTIPLLHLLAWVASSHDAEPPMRHLRCRLLLLSSLIACLSLEAPQESCSFHRP